MISVKCGKIYLVRGDCEVFGVSTVCIANDVRQIELDDTLYLFIKKNLDDEACVLEKTIIGTNLFTFEPEDTLCLEPGEYYYSIYFQPAGGKPKTIVYPCDLHSTEMRNPEPNFILVQEVAPWRSE